MLLFLNIFFLNVVILDGKSLFSFKLFIGMELSYNFHT